MKNACSNNCLKAFVLIQESSLMDIIKDFIENIEQIDHNPYMIQQFYDYVKLKYKIPCEAGMLFIEKITMINIFDRFKIKIDQMNGLINRKIFLYQWIRHNHLEIQDLDLAEVIEEFRKIRSSEVPSVKKYHLMNSISMLYGKVGRDIGCDGFFPYLVYCLIKSEIKDVYAHVYLIKLFRRNYENNCKFGCSHGFNMAVGCDCLVSANWNDEDEYYITLTLSALEYIAKIEFYNLKIGSDEFDNEIVQSLKKIEIKGNLDDESFET